MLTILIATTVFFYAVGCVNDQEHVALLLLH